tara:strand:+ start:543 stop:833 length:291 start_codon:yes stop_codon:yes gene_type:complete
MENPGQNTVTVEVYKKDKRTRKGEKLVSKEDIELNSVLTRELLAEQVESYIDSKKCRFEIHTTYVEKMNIMSKQTFWERYDTPYYCSPSSETYFSM